LKYYLFFPKDENFCFSVIFSLFFFQEVFFEQYKREFGFVLTGRKIHIDDIRVRGIGKKSKKSSTLALEKKNPTPISWKSTYFEGGRRKTPIYNLKGIDF